MAVNAVPIEETIAFREPLTPGHANALGTAIREHYLVPRIVGPAASNYRTWQDPRAGQTEFYFEVDITAPSRPGGTPERVPVNIHLIISTRNVRVLFTSEVPIDDTHRAILRLIADDIREFVAEFLERARRSAVHVVLDPYPPAPGTLSGTSRQGNQTIRKVFTGNSTNLFLIILLFTFPLILFIGVYAIVLMIAVQAFVLFYSDRLALRMGSVRPSADRPKAAVLGVALPEGPGAPTSRQVGRRVPALRVRLEETLAGGDVADKAFRAKALDTLHQSGINCSEEDLEFTVRDVYGLVQRAAQRFALPMPKVVLSDNPVSNAAATGISPRRATMLITAGSLEELDDAQLEAVIGHELGHIRGRDPVILLASSAVLYLGGIFVWPAVLFYLGIWYFVLALALVYLFGKVLETRADTYSATVLGSPKELASALTTIAFAELYLERRSISARFFRWLTLDSHPPVYFRIERLLRMAAGKEPVRSPFWSSARDCLAGFFGAVVGRA